MGKCNCCTHTSLLRGHVQILLSVPWVEMAELSLLKSDTFSAIQWGFSTLQGQPLVVPVTLKGFNQLKEIVPFSLNENMQQKVISIQWNHHLLYCSSTVTALEQSLDCLTVTPSWKTTASQMSCEVLSYTDEEVKQEWNQRCNFIRVKQMYTYLTPR